MEVMLIYLFGFALAGSSIKQRGLSLFVVCCLVIALPCTLWLTGKV
jgi:hypothetical protein